MDAQLKSQQGLTAKFAPGPPSGLIQSWLQTLVHSNLRVEVCRHSEEDAPTW